MSFGRTALLNLLTQLLGYSSNMLLTPVLPLFLAAQGHGEVFIGLVISAFSVTSTPVRPFLGRISDTGRLRSTLSIAGLLLGLAPFGYIIPSAPVLFVVRGLHGLGWAGLNVAGGAWSAFLAPPVRRAEFLGYLVLAQNMGIAVGPVAGLWMTGRFGSTSVFALAGVLGLLAMAAALGTRSADQPPPKPAAHSVKDLIEPGALPATLLVFLVQVNQTPMSAYIPLYFRYLQVEGRELYFLATGLVSILGLIALGRWADRLGRARAIGGGLTLQLAGLVAIALAADPLPLILGGTAYFMGYAMSQPSFYALAIDLSPKDRSGAAMATYTMAYQLGGGFGAALWGVIIELTGYRTMYALTLVPAALALVLTPVFARRRAPV
jgi:MFS family permease